MMRLETIAPRTWLLLSIAAWSVVVWGLALFGLGGRIVPLPLDPDQVANLPHWQSPPPERLGSLDQYPDFGSRPLYFEGRRPLPFFIEGADDGAPREFDYRLSSVLITPGLRMAILAGQDGQRLRVREGEAVQGLPNWRLQQVQPRSAVLEGPDGTRTLELEVFDGVGGEAPTVLAVRPAPATPARRAAETPASSPAPPPGAVTDAAAPPGTPATTAPAAEAPAMTTEQQMDAIRKRIEARRRQMRESPASRPSPAPTR
ncbi:general secretion pathway protein GspN [Pseudoxanthomonas kalamensis]|uniref:general secretion pathway protein GspN n=1 Tax=Pseudoxanthomonas kalamensis TaxID=289483 RepID=UPI001391C3BF|nr:general secretion pathway protein GspN [Pseudoxanthomonas kalamensis]